MVLHTVSAAPGSSAFDDCLRLAGAGDTVVLLGNGVYAALPGSAACARLHDCPADVALLQQDAAAAGCSSQEQEFPLLSMDQLVQLTERYPRQLAWY